MMYWCTLRHVAVDRVARSGIEHCVDTETARICQHHELSITIDMSRPKHVCHRPAHSDRIRRRTATNGRRFKATAPNLIASVRFVGTMS